MVSTSHKSCSKGYFFLCCRHQYSYGCWQNKGVQKIRESLCTYLLLLTEAMIPCAEESDCSFDCILLWHDQEIKQSTQKQYFYNSHLINDEQICKFDLHLIFPMFSIFWPFHFSCQSVSHYFVTHYLLLCYSVKEHPCPNVP